jgi:hypothetical protein
MRGDFKQRFADGDILILRPTATALLLAAVFRLLRDEFVRLF